MPELPLGVVARAGDPVVIVIGHDTYEIPA